MIQRKVKSQLKGDALTGPLNPKALKREGKSSPNAKATQVTVAGKPTSPLKRTPPIENSIWSDDTFDDIELTDTHLPLLEDFPVDYKVVSNHPSSKWYNLKEVHLPRVLLIE